MDKSDRNVPRKLASMNLDGTSPEVLITDDLHHVDAIFCDVSNGYVYFSEGVENKVAGMETILSMCFVQVERYHIANRTRTLFLQYPNVHHVLGMAKHDKYLYYLDLSYETIYKVTHLFQIFFI